MTTTSIGTLGARIMARDGEIERLRKVLEWYAEPTRYAVTQTKEPRSVVHQDGGQRARDALRPAPADR